MDLNQLFFWRIEKQGFGLCRKRHHGKNSQSNFQPTGYIFFSIKLVLMPKTKDLEAQGLEFHSVEEALEDKDNEFFDTIILHDSI